MNEKEQILVSILASSDAVWCPDRSPADPTSPRRTVIYEKRRDFAAGGVDWNSSICGRRSETEAKRYSRALRELEQDRLLSVGRPKWARAAAVRLTELGDATARALVGLPSLSDAVTEMIKLDDRRDDPLGREGYQGQVWHFELALIAPDPDPDARHSKLVRLEECFLPALTRSWMVSNGTVQGHVHYALTAAGMAIVQQARNGDMPPAPDDSDPPSDETIDFYYGIFKSQNVSFDSASPQVPGEIGSIPLSESPARIRPGGIEAWGALIQANTPAAGVA